MPHKPIMERDEIVDAGSKRPIVEGHADCSQGCAIDHIVRHVDYDTNVTYVIGLQSCAPADDTLKPPETTHQDFITSYGLRAILNQAKRV